MVTIVPQLSSNEEVLTLDSAVANRSTNDLLVVVVGGSVKVAVTSIKGHLHTVAQSAITITRSALEATVTHGVNAGTSVQLERLLVGHNGKCS